MVAQCLLYINKGVAEILNLCIDLYSTVLFPDIECLQAAVKTTLPMLVTSVHPNA